MAFKLLLWENRWNPTLSLPPICSLKLSPFLSLRGFLVGISHCKGFQRRICDAQNLNETLVAGVLAT